MNEEIKKILERVKKLIALASNNDNAHEAESALTMAHKLIAKYNLDASLLKGDEQEAHAKNTQRMKSSGPWARTICQGLAKLYFCKYYYISYGKRIDDHVFVGKTSNVEMAQMIADYVIGVIHNGSITAQRIGGIPARNSFRNAAGNRIYSRCVALVREAEAGQAVDAEGKNLPVLASLYKQAQQENDEWLAGTGIALTTGNDRQKISDLGAAMAGRAAGDAVPIRPTVGRDNVKAIGRD